VDSFVASLGKMKRIVARCYGNAKKKTKLMEYLKKKSLYFRANFQLTEKKTKV
jgi:hypothetical protein